MTSAALRAWLDLPNLMVSYERRGIVIMTVALRHEAATAVVAKATEVFRAIDGDPERIETVLEVVTMVREVLGGGDPQVLPLDGDETSALDVLFGAPS